MGSSIEVKKAPVESIDNVIDILDTLIAAKKVIQCKAIIIPAKKRVKNNLLEILRDIFLKQMNP